MVEIAEKVGYIGILTNYMIVDIYLTNSNTLRHGKPDSSNLPVEPKFATEESVEYNTEIYLAILYQKYLFHS